MRLNNSSKAVALVAFRLWLPSVSGQGTLKTFTNDRLHYTVQYPADWWLQIRENVFYIENFPPSMAVRGAGLPAAGAGLKILLPAQITRNSDAPPRSLGEFATAAASGRHILHRRSLNVRNDLGNLKVLELQTLCCGSITPYTEGIEWYFETGGQMFDATVFYWQGNSKSSELRETLKQVALSVHVTEH